jgi:hypothetical protein
MALWALAADADPLTKKRAKRKKGGYDKVDLVVSSFHFSPSRVRKLCYQLKSQLPSAGLGYFKCCEIPLFGRHLEVESSTDECSHSYFGVGHDHKCLIETQHSCGSKADQSF